METIILRTDFELPNGKHEPFDNFDELLNWVAGQGLNDDEWYLQSIESLCVAINRMNDVTYAYPIIVNFDW